jgi:opacity protein-like surface antigen
MFAKTLLLTACSLAVLTTRVHADDSEIDVHSFEYIDVVETSDGSVWKGVIVEQTPGVQYKLASADGSLHVLKAGDVTKISKQKNREWRSSVATRDTGSGEVGERGSGVVAHDEGSALPAPFATSGLRIDPSFVLVIPAGDISKLDTSFSPSVKVGYEKLLGNIGLEGGALMRFTYWQLPMGEDPNDAAWTLETHAYGRAALHAGRLAFYGGGSLGLDTNMVHIGALNMSKNSYDLGVNVQAGAEIAATRAVAIGIGFDYHPGTDTVLDGAPGSISYYGIHAGASVRM